MLLLIPTVTRWRQPRAQTVSALTVWGRCYGPIDLRHLFDRERSCFGGDDAGGQLAPVLHPEHYATHPAQHSSAGRTAGEPAPKRFADHLLCLAIAVARRDIKQIDAGGDRVLHGCHASSKVVGPHNMPSPPPPRVRVDTGHRRPNSCSFIAASLTSPAAPPRPAPGRNGRDWGTAAPAPRPWADR